PHAGRAVRVEPHRRALLRQGAVAGAILRRVVTLLPAAAHVRCRGELPVLRSRGERRPPRSHPGRCPGDPGGQGAFGDASRNGTTTSKPTMGHTTLAILVTVAFSIVGVLGDYFLKLASAREQPLRTGWFYLGFALYASTAFGWVFVMKHLKLATISVLYSVSMVLLLTAVGVVVFRESLNSFELAGIVLAVASLVLLVRFA